MLKPETKTNGRLHRTTFSGKINTSCGCLNTGSLLKKIIVST